MGWTNTESMWEYWLVFTSKCPTLPDSMKDEPDVLGESGYPSDQERQFLAEIRSNPLLGEISEQNDDFNLLYAAVPICVGVRDLGMTRDELSDGLLSTSQNQRVLPKFIEVTLTYLCPT